MKKLLAGLLLAAVAVACSDSTSVESVAGTYALSTVGGQSVPLTVDSTDADNKLEILSGSANLNSNGNYTVSFGFRLTDAGVVSQFTETDTGTWTVSGNTLTFTSSEPGEDPQTATVSGNTITVVTDLDGIPVTLVFQK